MTFVIFLFFVIEISIDAKITEFDFATLKFTNSKKIFSKSLFDIKRMNISMIIFHVLNRHVRKIDYQLNIIIVANIDKILNSKSKFDFKNRIWFEIIFENHKIFRYENVEKLSLHRIHDHIIRFIEDNKFDFDFLYDMFCDEFIVFKKYFIDNFKKDFIKSNQIDCDFFVLFVRKFENELRFCVDYRNFNVIIQKNRYSLSLFKEILMRLCAIKHFIVINIIVVFNRLRMIFEKEWKIVFRIRYDLFEYLVKFFWFLQRFRHLTKFY